MRNFNENEKFTVNGVEFKFIKVSAKNSGETHVWGWNVEAQKQTQILVSDIDVDGVIERAAAFINHHGKQPNYVYMAFIAEMKRQYFNVDNALHHSISDHDDFTRFIKNNAHKYSLEE
ncbi:hypothetical protein NVP1228O_45 [Vibrio phage 1.228.O._10N.261.49.C1]|nr:hypothetical protein NVP1157O_40 [Vibrio phage 1.157.O._10N.261.45.B7]AUR96639.1 hypothetical protein NVP1228O_45 [Vibrio phage 1.228.O._10N.261.49.C1]